MKCFWIALVFALVALFGAPAGAEPPSSKRPLTQKETRRASGIISSTTTWRWRPRHDELVRTRTRREEKRRIRELVRMDPKTGDEEVLFDLSTLDDQVPKKACRVRGIGRKGPQTIQWTEDGKSFCTLVRGHLVWIDLAHVSGKDNHPERVRVLTKFAGETISDVRVAPDGSGVAFCKDYEQWVVLAAKGEPFPLTTGGSDNQRNAGLDWVYPEELAHTTSTWWSPDGKSLAVLQLDQTDVPTFDVPRVLPLHAKARTMRYPKAGDPNPKARLRLYPIDGKGAFIEVKLGDPAPEYIVRVTWRPNSDHLLVVTMDRAQRVLQMHWCDPATGKSAVVHEEKNAAWLDVPKAPHFIDDSTFVWWDQSEDRAQWVVARAAETGIKIEIEERRPVFESGGDVSARPVWGNDFTAHANARMPAGNDVVLQRPDEGPTTVRTFEGAKGTSVRASWCESGLYVMVTASSADRPPVTSLHTADGKRLRVLGDAKGKKFDEIAWPSSEDGEVPIPDHDGNVRWRMWKPTNFDASKSYPVVVYTYGGPNARMLRSGWSRGLLRTTYYTQHGFLVLFVDGRGCGGQSREHTRCVQGRLGRHEIDDHALVVQELAKRPYVDGARVGIWGWSFGGTMACNGVIFRGDVFKAACAVAPVTDWRLYDSIYTERYMGLPKDNAKGYDESSSVKHAKDLKGHLLILHGLADDNVHAQNSYRLQEALIKAKKTTFDVVTYPDRGHGIGGPAHNDVHRRILEFFEKHLTP